jgi:hypothetical protein
MSCGNSKEILALYVENDLGDSEANRKVASHLAVCHSCRQYCEELRRSQSFIKSRSRAAGEQPVTGETLAELRRSVMSQIDAVEQSFSWALRLERFFMPGLRSHRYAAVALVAVVVVSASLLGQMRYTEPHGRRTAVFAGQNTLLSPATYREWISAGPSAADGHREIPGANHNVYIHPDAYREYSRSGKFPEGTVIVRETSHEMEIMALQVAVKDSSRFQDGWGFYDFSPAFGKADEAPQSAGCIACHRDKGATDHVFTQFYPVLRTVGS